MKQLTPVVILCLALACIGCSHRIASQRDGKAYVVLMAGQSNMAGQGRLSEIGPPETPENVVFYNVMRSGRIGPSTRSFGPEVMVMKRLGEAFPRERFIVIKYAVGGSSLLDWAPEYSAEKAAITGHPEFGNMFATFVAKIDSLTNSQKVEFLSLLWMQGERDARVPEAGKDYYANFKAFIRAIRSETSRALPVVYGLVNPDPEKYPAVATVQSAQRRIAAEDPHAYLIDTSSLAKWKDNLHYSTEGQLALGERFAERLIDIAKKKID